MNGTELLLDRALYHARAGQVDPSYCLIAAAEELKYGKDYPPEEGRALAAVMEAAGDSLTRWKEARLHNPRAQKIAETVALLKEALFNVQVAG